MPKRVLLVIDMLKDFVYDDGALTCGKPAQEIVPYIQKLLAEFRAGGDKIIYLADAHSPDDPEFEMFPPHCIAGTPGAEVIDELKPQPGDLLIHKTRYSGFFRTNLEQVLEELKPDEVHVVGVCTSICVLFTVADLRNRFYPTFVHEKGVADFDPEAHRFSLKHMDKVLGAKIV